MFARFRTLWENVSTSLWFVPGILIAGAALLASLAVSVRSGVPDGGAATWWLHSGTAEQAFDLLASLLTGMITMATLVVSITVVVLTLAAAHLGPRLIRSFMADRQTQFSLGIFLGTVVYLVLALGGVSSAAGDDSVPHLAVTIGAGLMLICVLLLLFFVHHLARSIVADAVIHRVGDDLDAAILATFPEADEDSAARGDFVRPAEDGAILRLAAGGYVQAIDYRRLVEVAGGAGAVVVLDFRPGQHLLPGGTHGRVFPASVFSEQLAKDVSACAVVGGQRTAAQDAEFAVRQLVEVALRALSPGINDPFTAIAVIDRLGASLALLLRRGPALDTWCDAAGTICVTGQASDFAGILDAAFNQIRQSGSGHPAILMRLLETLGQLAEHVRSPEQRSALSRHVELVEAQSGRSVSDRYDLQALDRRSSAARARLAPGDAGTG